MQALKRPGQSSADDQLRGRNARRTLFERLARLLRLPVLPLFVFDGPARPRRKRDKLIDAQRFGPGSLQHRFASMVAAFGFQVRIAPGEAEAELAYLGGLGIIDIIMTDDVDVVLFGATRIVSTWGFAGRLSTGRAAWKRSQQNGNAKSTRHIITPELLEDQCDEEGFTSPRPVTSDLQNTDLSNLSEASEFASLKQQSAPLGFSYIVASYDAIRISQCLSVEAAELPAALILVALLGGGDYDTTGLTRAGPMIAIALAQAGFATRLLQGFSKHCKEPAVPIVSVASWPTSTTFRYPKVLYQDDSVRTDEHWETFIAQWRSDVAEELMSNSKGFLPHRQSKLAKSTAITEFLSTQQDLQTFAKYVWPVTSATLSSAEAVAAHEAYKGWSESHVAWLAPRLAHQAPNWDSTAEPDAIMMQLVLDMPGAAIEATRRYKALIVPGLCVRALRLTACHSAQNSTGSRCDERSGAKAQALSFLHRAGVQLAALSERSRGSFLHGLRHYAVQVTAKSQLERVYAEVCARSTSGRQEAHASTPAVQMLLESYELCYIEGSMLSSSARGRQLIADGFPLVQSRGRKLELEVKAREARRIAPKRRQPLISDFAVPVKKARLETNDGNQPATKAASDSNGTVQCPSPLHMPTLTGESIVLVSGNSSKSSHSVTLVKSKLPIRAAPSALRADEVVVISSSSSNQYPTSDDIRDFLMDCDASSQDFTLQT